MRVANDQTSYEDADYTAYKNGTISSGQLYNRWKRKAGLSFWAELLDEFRFAFWAIQQALTALLVGRVPADLGRWEKDDLDHRSRDAYIFPESLEER